MIGEKIYFQMGIKQKIQDGLLEIYHEVNKVLLSVTCKFWSEQNLVHYNTICDTQSSACKLETTFRFISMNLQPNKDEVI